MTRQSKGAVKRQRKRRESATELEVKAFKHGMQVAREAIGPEIWKRAAIRAGSLAFVLGVGVGGALVHYFG